MNIAEIENLSFSELKAGGVNLVEAAQKLPAEELAARYVQARTDAKQRDEKLAEQGETIRALHEGLGAGKEKVQSLNAELAKAREESAAFSELLKQQRVECEGHMAALKRERERSGRFKSLAAQHHQAVSQAARLLNDAIAAAAVDSADKGD